MSRNAPIDLLVCYDISEPRRLRRVHQAMRAWGMPIQYSVFYCRLTQRQRQRLESRLRALIEQGEDDVRVYGIQALQQIEFYGPAPTGSGIEVLTPQRGGH